MPPAWILEAIGKGLYTKQQIHSMYHCIHIKANVLTGVAAEYDQNIQECLTLGEGIRDSFTTPVVNRHEFATCVVDRDAYAFSGKDVDALVKCLRRMLVVDPANRATSRELLTEEEWFRALSPSP